MPAANRKFLTPGEANIIFSIIIIYNVVKGHVWPIDDKVTLQHAHRPATTCNEIFHVNRSRRYLPGYQTVARSAGRKALGSMLVGRDATARALPDLSRSAALGA